MMAVGCEICAPEVLNSTTYDLRVLQLLSLFSRSSRLRNMNGGISCVRRFSVNYIHCCILAIPRISVCVMLCTVMHAVYGLCYPC